MARYVNNRVLCNLVLKANKVCPFGISLFQRKLKRGGTRLSPPLDPSLIYPLHLLSHLSRRALNKENKTRLAIIKVMIPVALVICKCVEDFNSGQPNTYSASGEVEDLHPGPPR